jgi:hypothetical protein
MPTVSSFSHSLSLKLSQCTPLTTWMHEESQHQFPCAAHHPNTGSENLFALAAASARASLTHAGQTQLFAEAPISHHEQPAPHAGRCDFLLRVSISVAAALGGAGAALLKAPQAWSTAGSLGRKHHDVRLRDGLPAGLLDLPLATDAHLLVVDTPAATRHVS